VTSSISRAKAGLLAILESALDAESVQVSWGQPGNDDIANETVWIDDARGTDRFTIGMVSSRESYVLPIVIEALDEGNDARLAEERCWELAGLVETALRADASLDGAAGVLSAVISGKRFGSFTLSNGRLAAVNIDVKLESRI
jgi:hypothetical protein